VATLSLPGQPDEGDNSDVTIVLTDEVPSATPDASEEPTVAQRAVEDNDHRLADFIAHELRNPIGAIQGIARVLRVRNDAISESDRAAALHSVEADAQRALLILEGLLNLARTRRRVGLETAQVPVHGILRKVVTEHHSRNPNRPVALSGDSPLYARADSMGVELALGNLLNNAEKYASRDSEIEISSHQEGNRVTIVVANEGVSLPSERYQKLWDVYSKGPDPDVVVTGSGIGLALCKELVEAMGGRVWAGPRKGGGSSFAITLPGLSESGPPSPAEPQRYRAATESGSDWSANVA
jgi:two-component system sensor histidine kinase KdpD